MRNDSIKQRMPFSDLTTFIFFTIVLLPFLYFIWLVLFNSAIIASEFFMLIGWMLGVVILTIWSFLRKPVTVINKYKMEILSGTNPELAKRLLNLAATIKLKHIPIFLRIPNDQSPLVFAFGTWRHQYIAISDKALEVWSNEQELDAVMLHEFGHLASGDVWKTGLSFEYLKWFGVSGAFLLLSSIFKTNFTVSVFDILVSIGLVVTALTISLAVRFLFRIRELVADEFASNCSVDKSYINIFRSIGKNSKSDSEYSVIDDLYYNHWLARLLNFHPDTKSRLMVSQGKGEDIFNRGVPNLLFAAGLLIGQFTSFHSDISLVYKLLIGGTLFFAPFFLSLSLTSSNIENITDRSFLLLESTIKLIAGVALSFIIQVLPNTFFETNPIDGKGFLVQSPIGLYHYISLFWDTLLILMLVLPLILFVVVWIFDITTRLVFASLGISRPAIVPWLIQSPLFIFLHWEWQNWSTGNSFTIKYALFFTSFWVLWIIAFYVFFRKQSQGISINTSHKDLL